MITRETSGPLTSLVKKVDAEIAENEKLKSFVVVLTDDYEKTALVLEALAKDLGLKSVPLTLIESTTGPAQYDVAEDAAVTVMMWRNGKVRINHAYKEGAMTEADVATILTEIPRILD